MKRKKLINGFLCFAGVCLAGIIIYVTAAVWPEQKRVLTSEEQVAEVLAEMSLHEKICQMLIVQPEALTKGTVQDADLLFNFVMEYYPVGGFLFKAQNMKSKEQVTKMLSGIQKCSGLKLFFACDEEGGTVSRLMRTVGTTQIGSMFDYRNDGGETAYQNAYTIASDMSALGFNLDFAPVADVWSNPENTVIGKRAYSDDYLQAAELVAAAVKGFHDGGVATTLKHFPGHGDTVEDSHQGSAYVSKTLSELRAEEFLPFCAGIDAGSEMVMMGHLVLKELGEEPVLFNYDIVTKVLREELGFEGVIITDSLDMGAVTRHYTMEETVIRSINAGVDVLLCPGSVPKVVEIIKKAVKDGKIAEERIDESVLRILKMKIE